MVMRKMKYIKTISGSIATSKSLMKNTSKVSCNEYEQDFNQNTEILKKSNVFKKKEEAQRFIDDLHKIELYYFILAHEQKNDVLIVNTSNKKEQKQFLGYEWSNIERVKYQGGETVHHALV